MNLRMNSFKDKNILITGAALGLGREMAKLLAPLAKELWLLDIRREELHLLANEIAGKGAKIREITMDLTKESWPEISAIQELDILINNAAIVPGGKFFERSWHDHQRTLRVNLEAPLRLCHHFWPQFSKNPKALVINIASISAFLGFAGASSYAASKWGLMGFSESLRLERPGFHMTVACPSYIQTGMFEGAKAPFIAGFLDPQKLAKNILKAADKRKFVYIAPAIARIAPILRAVLPFAVWEFLLRLFKIDSGMQTWRGR